MIKRSDFHGADLVSVKCPVPSMLKEDALIGMRNKRRLIYCTGVYTSRTPKGNSRKIMWYLGPVERVGTVTGESDLIYEHGADSTCSVKCPVRADDGYTRSEPIDCCAVWGVQEETAVIEVRECNEVYIEN